MNMDIKSGILQQGWTVGALEEMELTSEPHIWLIPEEGYAT